MTVKKVKLEEFVTEWCAPGQRTADEARTGAVKHLERFPTAAGLVLFRNNNFDASAYGASTVGVFGPDCAWKCVADFDGKPLGTAPSDFQYPVCWIAREDVLDPFVQTGSRTGEETGKKV